MSVFAAVWLGLCCLRSAAVATGIIRTRAPNCSVVLTAWCTFLSLYHSTRSHQLLRDSARCLVRTSPNGIWASGGPLGAPCSLAVQVNDKPVVKQAQTVEVWTDQYITEDEIAQLAAADMHTWGLDPKYARLIERCKARLHHKHYVYVLNNLHTLSQNTTVSTPEDINQCSVEGLSDCGVDVCLAFYVCFASSATGKYFSSKAEVAEARLHQLWGDVEAAGAIFHKQDDKLSWQLVRNCLSHLCKGSAGQATMVEGTLDRVEPQAAQQSWWPCSNMVRVKTKED